MPVFDTRTLITDLQATLRDQLATVEELRGKPVELLHCRPAPDRWSVMEIFAHMVLSSGHYRDGSRRIYSDPNSRLRLRRTFKSGRWGELMTRGMAPRTGGRIAWKMRTMRMFEPRTAHVEGTRALEDFVALCRDLVDLLEAARTRGLEGERVVSTLGPILRFKVGDAFRFVVAHQQRHMLQIERTLRAVEQTVGSVQHQ